MSFWKSLVAASIVLVGSSSSVFASPSSDDPRGCKADAMEAAEKRATRDYPGFKEITADNVYQIRASETTDVTVYDVAVSRWIDESDSVGLTYEVVTRGSAPSCKVVRVTLTGEE